VILIGRLIICLKQRIDLLAIRLPAREVFRFSSGGRMPPAGGWVCDFLLMLACRFTKINGQNNIVFEA
jgi:hypothetical protein